MLCSFFIKDGSLFSLSQCISHIPLPKKHLFSCLYFQILELLVEQLLCSFLQITIGEIFHVHYLPHRSRSTISNPYVTALYKEIGAFLFGCCVGQSLTNMAKVAVGRLRPHFLAVCQPNFTHIVCSAGYLEDYICTGSRSKEKEARYVL